MRKKIFFALHMVSVALLVLFLVGEFIVPFFSITKYVMPPEQGPAIFGGSVEEVWDIGRRLGYWVYSKKDEDGNLVFYMNQFQREAYIKECNITIDVARRTRGVDISSDYKTITVYQYAPDTVFFSLGRGLAAIFDCWSMQYMNGEDFSEMYVEFRVVDVNTQEQLYDFTFTYPDIGDIYVTFSEKSIDFSKRP